MSGSRGIAVALGVAGLVCTLAGLLWLAERSEAIGTPPHPVWAEMPWPFPMDQWGQGKAFACKAADCGTEVRVYLRAKIGFCNCTEGVADDAELERLSDFDLIGGNVSAEGQGRPISVAWMKGRSRAYAVSGSPRGGRSALSVAYNDGCDAIVASAVLGRTRFGEIEPDVMEFLNSPAMVRWAKAALGQ